MIDVRNFMLFNLPDYLLGGCADFLRMLIMYAAKSDMSGLM